MNATTIFREEVLRNLDSLFDNSGYRRRKSSYAWRHKISKELTGSLHCNFGLYPHTGELSMIPTVNVRYESIERMLFESGVISHATKDRATFGRTLPQLSGHQYTCKVSENPEAITNLVWQDWQLFGEPYLLIISQIELVIQILKSESPADCCCPSRSHRARLLPLALRLVNRNDDALAEMDRLILELQGQDQIRPSIEEFYAWFINSKVASTI